VRSVEVGHRVLIPFGRRTTTGVCVGFPDAAQVPELKPIKDLLHPDCRFDAHLLEFTRWIAEYYQASWGEVLEAALPPTLRSGKGERTVRWISAEHPSATLLEESERWTKKAPVRARLLEALARNPGARPCADLLKEAEASSGALRWLVDGEWAREEHRPYVSEREEPDLDALTSRAVGSLHATQEDALRVIMEACDSKDFKPILLHGVTGSGKTEVYLRALREVVEQGRRGLVLVPEISLTPQTVLRFQRGLPAPQG